MKFFVGLTVFLATLHSIWSADFETDRPDWQANFDKGMREGSFGAGVYLSPVLSENRPTEDFVGPLLQIGYMLNEPNYGTVWRGNFEVAAELFGGGIYEGKGNYVASTTIWLRYNLLPPRAKLVPYLQVGTGVTFTDADQSIFGQILNFNTGGAAGIRYFIKRNCSLNGEYRLQHISNAGLAKRNFGSNAQGAVLSVSWYF